MPCKLQRMRWKCLVTAGLTFALFTAFSGRSGLPVVEADQVVINLYPEGKLEAEALVRVGKVRRAFERRGFFRIGVLPVLLVQDVAIEFQQPQPPRATLGRIARELSGFGSKGRINLEKVTWRFPGEAEPRLRVDSIKFGSRGSWELSGNIQFMFAGQSVRVRKAQLQVSGDEAGKLVLAAPDQIIITDLFDPQRRENQKHPNPLPP